MRFFWKYFVVIIFAAIWIIVINSEIENSPEQFNIEYSEIGINQIVSNLDAPLSEKFTIEEKGRHKVIGVNGDVLKIEAEIIGKNIVTDETIFHFHKTFDVDKKTRKHIDESLGYFTFPKNTQKQDYFMTYPDVTQPATFTFIEEKVIEDLLLYRFDCEHSGNDISFAFPQFKPFKIEIDAQCTMYVEPTTGNVVFFALAWQNYFVDNGEKTKLAETGSKQTTDYNTLILVENTKQELENKRLHYILSTLVFIIIFVGFLIVDIFQKHKSKLEFEKKQRLELEFENKQKLELLGKMSANLSHELRNYITTISLIVSMMKHKLGSEEKPLQKDISVLEENVSRMIHQINNTLNVLKFQSYDFKNIQLKQLCENVISSIALPTNIEISLKGDELSADVDKEKIISILNNILQNAIQAIGSDNGKIEIRLRSETNRVIIEIENSGPAIPPDKLDKIFDYLYTSKTNGTGLGLGICKQFVDGHGGAINVKTNPVVFTISIPITRK